MGRGVLDEHRLSDMFFTAGAEQGGPAGGRWREPVRIGARAPRAATCLAGLVLVGGLVIGARPTAAQSLGGTFSQASGLARSFRLKGMGRGALSRPTWSPSFSWGASVAQPKPPSPTDLAVETQIRKRQQRIAKLRRHREAWRVALEKLDAHENWREELDSHLEESQVAQIGALQTSTGLIMGVAGPVSDALAARADLARRLKRVVARLRLQLRELDPIIKRVEAASGRSLDHRRVARQLRELHDELTRATRSEVALSRLLGDLVTFGDRLMKVASFVELIKDVRTKHEALAAAKLLDDMVVDAFKEAGVAEVTEGMARRGLHQGARSIKLLSFGVDYGYHSLRFYLAWDGVQQVLGRIDDKNRLRGHMSQQIVSLTNAAKAEEAELAQLRQARGNRARSQAVLQTLRQRELKAAYQAGEWFSQQRGVAAPGGPLRP